MAECKILMMLGVQLTHWKSAAKTWDPERQRGENNVSILHGVVDKECALSESYILQKNNWIGPIVEE